jgi:uncharacterized membrane protein YhaH (DUF805 family)
MIGIKDAYLLYFKKVFDFKGKSTRREFWIPMIINAIICLVIYLFTLGGTLLGISSIILTVTNLLYKVFELLTFIPSMSISIRRLHDIGRTCITYIVGFVGEVVSEIIVTIGVVLVFLGEMSLEGGPNLLELSTQGIKSMESMGGVMIVLFLLVTLAIKIVMLVFYCQPSISNKRKQALDNFYENPSIANSNELFKDMQTIGKDEVGNKPN